MSLPPAKHFAWPVRVGVASCLTSLLTLVRNDDFNLAVTSVVFGVVVTIVAASDTLGATLATSWAIVGGATIGCVLSALCVALFGTSVAAVLVANALVGVAVLYPEKFPVVSQKFAFGGSTIFVWTAFAGADTRWMTLGIPLSTAIGACSAIIVTAFGKCNADDAVAAAADACAEAVADAAADAVAAYVADDVSAREALRARVESGRKDAERSLAKMKDAAAHAVWERRLTGALASVFATRSSRGGANGGGAGGEGGSAKKRAPEASAGAFAEVTLHLRGMTLALDGGVVHGEARGHGGARRRRGESGGDGVSSERFFVSIRRVFSAKRRKRKPRPSRRREPAFVALEAGRRTDAPAQETLCAGRRRVGRGRVRRASRAAGEPPVDVQLPVARAGARGVFRPRERRERWFRFRRARQNARRTKRRR